MMAEMKNTALDTLIGVLKTSGADAWEVTETEEKGWEFYFIRHSLDQHRVKNIRSFSVKVYRKFDDCLGSAKAGVPADATEEEMRRTVEGLCRDASYVRNPFYTLNKPAEGAAGDEPEAIDPETVSGDFIRALAAVPETGTEDLNSYEIFVSGIRRRYLNSEGVDVTSVYPASMVDAVVNARKDGHEIEPPFPRRPWAGRTWSSPRIPRGNCIVISFPAWTPAWSTAACPTGRSATPSRRRT